MTAKLIRVVLILALWVTLDSCQSSNTHGTRPQRKSYKPGKPIPCPLKDC